MKNHDSNKEIAVVNQLTAEEAQAAGLAEELIDIEGLVRIHIDREVYESPNPTAGEALYEPAHIAEHRELFRESAATIEKREGANSCGGK